jgi:hypothetical protein
LAKIHALSFSPPHVSILTAILPVPFWFTSGSRKNGAAHMASFIQLLSGSLLVVALIGLVYFNFSVVAGWNYGMICHYLRQEGMFVPGGPFGIVVLCLLAGAYSVSFVMPKA